MNNFTAGNYPDWATPVADLDKLSLTMDSKAMTYEFSMPDGTTVSGTYTLDEKVFILLKAVCLLIISVVETSCSLPILITSSVFFAWRLWQEM